MKRSRLSLVSAVVILLIVMAAFGRVVQADDSPTATDWPQFQKDEVNSGKTSDLAPTNSPVMTWRQFTYQSGGIGIEVVPIVAGDMVYVYAGDGLWAWDKKSGELKWQKGISGHGGLQTSTPAYGDGKLFIATFDGYLFAFDAITGDELWGKRVSQRGFQCPITYHDHKIYIGGGGTGGETNSYYCFSDNGTSCWSYSANTTGYLWCGASVVGNYLVFGNVDGILTCVNKSTGELVDELALTGSDISFPRADAGKIRASVAYHNGYVYTTSESGLDTGYIWKVGFDPSTGNFLNQGWSIPIGFSTSTPVIYEGKVYVGQGEHGNPGSLICLNDTSGEIIWAYPVEGGVKSSPAFSIQEEGAYIYFPTSMDDGFLYCLKDDGTLAWKWDPPDDAYILQGAAISGGAVFLGTCSGYLYAVESCPDWDGEWPQFQKDKANSGKTWATAPTASVRVAWSAFTHYNSTHGIDVTPIVANGKVFVIDVDEYAWAFDAASGNMLWSTPLVSGPRFTLATPAYGEGKVFFATDTGYIYALDDATGVVMWGGKLTEGVGQNAELNTQITYDSGKLYVGSWEGKYYCLDSDGNGSSPSVDWTYAVEGTRYDWYSGAAVIGDYVLFGNTDGILTCLEKSTGDMVDSCDLNTEFGITAGSIRSAVSTNEEVNRIYLTTRNGYVFAIGFDSTQGHFNSTSGWFASIDNYSTSTPVFYNGCVYVCSGGSFYNQEGGVYCFDDATGNQNWFNDLSVTYGSQASPAISIQDGDPYIYVSTGAPQAAVVCINAGGTLLWEYVPDHQEYILQGVAIAGGKVFFGNDAGYLYALEPCPDWDVNADGNINILDVARVGLRWGESGEPGWIREDVNNDGKVNILDVALIGIHWGE